MRIPSRQSTIIKRVTLRLASGWHSASLVFRPCAEASVGFTFGRAEESALWRCTGLPQTLARHSTFPVIDVAGDSRRDEVLLSRQANRPERI